MGIFRGGPADEPEYAFQTFRRHIDRIEMPLREGGFVALELGPGDSLFSALIARALGASATHLVDVAPFARADLRPYREMAQLLAERGLSAPDLAHVGSLAELLATCRACYATSGLDSLRAIPDASVDFVWSQAVLEHVRCGEFLETMQELHRVLRPDGVSSHRVDLRDHLDDGPNNLRFSNRVWESQFMASSGFYTNRLRYSEMLALFREAGFNVDVVSVDRWERLPLPRSRLAEAFRHLPDEELLVSGFDVVLNSAA